MEREISVNLIRHGKTAGNLKKRYIGTTDEELCPQGIRELQERSYPETDLWFSSPMKRCLQTAQIISGGRTAQIVPDFRECDFGLFENKNYLELADCPEYQQWIDSNGTLAFPQGERPERFRERSCRAFEQTVEQIFRAAQMAQEKTEGRITYRVEDRTLDRTMEGDLSATEGMSCRKVTASLVVHGGTIMSIMERYAWPHREYYQWHAENGDGYTLRIRETEWKGERCLKEWKPLFPG